MDVEVEVRQMNLWRAFSALAGRVWARRRQPAPVPDTAVRPPAEAGPEALERWALAALANGTLDAAGYRATVIELVPLIDPWDCDVAALMWRAVRGANAAEELHRLVCHVYARLPALPGSTIRAALALHRFGATGDELIRLLRLTRIQARTIITVAETHRTRPPA